MEPETWIGSGHWKHDFGHPDADGLRIEAYNDGMMDFTAFDGGLGDGEQATYGLDLQEQRTLLSILLDNLLKHRGALGGCPFAGIRFDSGLHCPLCGPKATPQENPFEANHGGTPT